MNQKKEQKDLDDLKQRIERRGFDNERFVRLACIKTLIYSSENKALF